MPINPAALRLTGRRYPLTVGGVAVVVVLTYRDGRPVGADIQDAQTGHPCTVDVRQWRDDICRRLHDFRSPEHEQRAAGRELRFLELVEGRMVSGTVARRAKEAAQWAERNPGAVPTAFGARTGD